jgi:uncharacterized radical SAM superfamily protein
MLFIEIYRSSFSNNTIYSNPIPIKKLEKALAETKEAGRYLRTVGIVTFQLKIHPHEYYINFKRLDMIKDQTAIQELIELHKKQLTPVDLFYNVK